MGHLGAKNTWSSELQTCVQQGSTGQVIRQIYHEYITNCLEGLGVSQITTNCLEALEIIAS